MKTQITISTDSEQTVPDGVSRQTLTAVAGRLALIPGTAGGTVSVTVNGQTYTNPDSITVSAGDTVTASGGVAVYRVTVPHNYETDGSDVFYGAKCAVVGDSIMSIQGVATGLADGKSNLMQAVKWWEFISGQYATRNNMPPTGQLAFYKRDDMATGINCYNGQARNESLYARGGTGYWNGDPFYKRMTYLHHDADIVIIYGSVNDWTFRTNGKTNSAYWPTEDYKKVNATLTQDNCGCFFSSCSMLHVGEALTWAEPSQTDIDVTVTPQYYSQYVARAIIEAHRQAPLAKIMVVNPWAYPAGGGAVSREKRNTQDIDWVRYVMTDYIRRTVPGADEWLMYRHNACDFSGTRYSNGRYTKVEGAWAEGPMKVPDWDGSGTERLFGYYPYEYGANFRALYCCPEGGGYPHPNTKTNDVCFAPVMAHNIADALGIGYESLPNALKYPDDGGYRPPYEPVDPDEPDNPDEPDEPDPPEPPVDPDEPEKQEDGVLSEPVRMLGRKVMTRVSELPDYLRERLSMPGVKLWRMKDGHKEQITWTEVPDEPDEYEYYVEAGGVLLIVRARCEVVGDALRIW